jgi:hypothetical protein
MYRISTKSGSKVIQKARPWNNSRGWEGYRETFPISLHRTIGNLHISVHGSPIRRPLLTLPLIKSPTATVFTTLPVHDLFNLLCQQWKCLRADFLRDSSSYHLVRPLSRRGGRLDPDLRQFSILPFAGPGLSFFSVDSPLDFARFIIPIYLKQSRCASPAGLCHFGT